MTLKKIKTTKGSVIHPSIQRTLKKLGEDIQLARRSRDLSAQDMADRMGVDRGTLRRLEQGDPGVSLNTVAMALSALNMLERLRDLVDPSTDDIGLLASRRKLPLRISKTRRKSSPSSEFETQAPQEGSPEPEGW
ncbi:helix-turn-helix transcriptional regulator [uncultured Cohaesibacter sp.]|uniref:helix-turn-helix domain-containing protein n=1 Tax=uncultured Cohaesibacter sp. TaxID=1002546 RepID=UPI002AA7A0B5|nr:helix-turn-helix transcriptional regulator [uncultured Cohaesibacter sp.]